MCLAARLVGEPAGFGLWLGRRRGAWPSAGFRPRSIGSSSACAGGRLLPRRRRSDARPCCRGGRLRRVRSAPSVSITTSTEPIAIWSPTSPASSIDLPATGHSISTVALSVIMSASCWSSSIVSPTLTCQATISASAMPSPMSGSLNSYRRHQSAITFSSAFFMRIGPGK